MKGAGITEMAWTFKPRGSSSVVFAPGRTIGDAERPEGPVIAVADGFCPTLQAARGGCLSHLYRGIFELGDVLAHEMTECAHLGLAHWL